MAFKKTKRSFKKKSSSKGALALTRVNKLMRQRELKFVNNNITDTTVSTGATVYDIFDNSQVVQGLTHNEIIGNQVHVKSLKVRLDLLAPASDATPPSVGHFRLIFFRVSSRGTSTEPGVADILESNTVLSHYNRTSQYKYQVLKDMIWTLTDPTLGKGSNRYHKEFNLKIDKEFKLQGTLNAIGSIYALVVHNYTDEKPFLEMKCRISYFDE